jgi:hypothetical protein
LQASVLHTAKILVPSVLQFESSVKVPDEEADNIGPLEDDEVP